jgi:hypothetical protein
LMTVRRSLLSEAKALTATRIGSIRLLNP